MKNLGCPRWLPPTNEMFLLGEKQLGIVSKYQYLGLLLTLISRLQ
jgi:hypothetical protein